MRHSAINLTLFILFLGFICSGCSSTLKDDLLGKWKVQKVDITPDSESHTSLNAELKSMIFDFKDDGLLLHSNFFRTGALGSWSLNESSDSLTCTYLYERATFTDQYAIYSVAGGLLLKTQDFESTEGVSIELVKQ